MIKKNKEKGISLLLAVLLLGVVLAIALGISLITVQQAKLMGEMGYSVIAFYAADNGIEEVLMDNSTPTAISLTELPNGATYQVTVEANGPQCDALNFCIKSIGTYKTTKRAIEIKY